MTVADLFDIVMGRISGEPQCSLLEAVGGVQSAIFRQLMLVRSDLIQDEVEMDFSAGEYQAALPNDFHAVASRPNISGEQKYLNLLDRAAGSVVLPDGEPRQYATKGRTFMVYPTPVVDVTIRVPVFVKPAVPVSLDDDLPYYGALDDVFAELCAAFMLAGPAVSADPAFVAQLNQSVGMALSGRMLADEQVMADSINYGR